MRQLQIDWTRCDGHGLCAQVMPDAIATDEWGFPILLRSRFSEDDLIDARRAVTVCPMLALRLR